MITTTGLYPPQPATTRAASSFISYDANNDRIAYAAGKSIIVRSLRTDSEHTPIQFTKHNFTTTVAAFSPSGNYVASGDESGNVKIWDSSVYGKDNQESKFEQPTIKSEFQILSGPIRSIAWDADNSRIIAVGQGRDQFGHCFSWDSGNSIGEIQGHAETINCVDIKSQRPYRAATVSDDKALVYFHGPPFKFDKSVRGHHTNSVKAVKFSPDGKYLVSVGSDRKIVLYDGLTSEVLSSKEHAHAGGIFGVSWTKDSSSFVTCSADNTLKEWSPETLEAKFTYSTSDNLSIDEQQVGVVVANDTIVSLSLNGNINLFNHKEKSPFKTYYGHQRAITAVCANGKNLVTGDAGGSLVQWELVDKKLLNPEPRPFGTRMDHHSNFVTSISAAGEGYVTAGWDDKLRSWSGNGQAEKVKALDSQPKHTVEKNGKLFVVFENAVEVLDARTLESISKKLLDFKCGYVDVVGENKVLVTNESQNRVEEYSVGTSAIEHVRSYPPARNAPVLIKVSPSGEWAAVADSAGKYYVYKTEDASLFTTRWAFHTSRVQDAQWTEDSKFLVSGGLDSGVYVFSTARPAKVLKHPLAHQNGVTGLAWTNYDGSKGSFVSTGNDGVVKTYDVDFTGY